MPENFARLSNIYHSRAIFSRKLIKYIRKSRTVDIAEYALIFIIINDYITYHLIVTQNFAALLFCFFCTVHPDHLTRGERGSTECHYFPYFTGKCAKYAHLHVQI